MTTKSVKIKKDQLPVDNFNISQIGSIGTHMYHINSTQHKRTAVKLSKTSTC